MLIHVVRPGESLWQIAVNYGVTLQALLNANRPPNPNRLVVGQSLVIPTEAVYHTVQSGETLWSIAGQYNTTVQAIAQANRITDPSRIYPGMQLYIPEVRHQVQRGETLYQIAQRYGVPLQELVRINNIQDPSRVNAGTILVIPRPKPVIDVNGYLVNFGESAVPIVNEVGQYLTYTSPFAYRITENGNLQPVDDAPAIRAAYANRIVPMLAITNFTSTELGANLAHVVLSSPELQERTIANAINVMNQKGYRVLNVDFENVLPADRENYNSFMQRAANRLHPLGYSLSSALAPKTGPTQTGLLYEAHDYAAHGRIADFVILMTYEWGYRLGPPQAISPINQIRRVLDYAVTVIPRSKIFFGFQIYARDWVLPWAAGQEAETFSCQEAIARAARFGAVIQYDYTAASPFFRYTDAQGRQHEVWFEDARSAQTKFDTVIAYRLRGISYWALGYPFPENWTLLAGNFIIRKRV